MADTHPWWQRVVFAADCRECECCGEPFCDRCQNHYADCECPGPSQDDIYEYDERPDGLYARKLQ